MNLSPLKLFITKNSPSILVGFGIAGVIATGISAGKASVTASHIIEEMNYTSEEKPTTKEKAKAVFPIYIPTIILGMATITCIAASHSIDIRRQAALCSAYSLSEKAMLEYENKVKEMFGEKKEEQVREAIRKDDIKNNPPSDSNVCITKYGDVLMRDDVVGGPDFTTDIEYLKSVFNDLNNRLNSCNFVTVNDLKYELGLPQTSYWDNYGWGPGDQLDPIWYCESLEKDLLLSTSKDATKTIYFLKYNHPTYLPDY